MGDNYIFFTEMCSDKYDEIKNKFKNRFQGFPVWPGEGWKKHNYVDEDFNLLSNRTPFNYMWVELVRGADKGMMPTEKEKELTGLQAVVVKGDFMKVLKDLRGKFKAEGIEDLSRYMETPELVWTAVKWYLPAYEHRETIERIIDGIGEKV